MIRYSIADLENLTGIKAHTIRIWEKRYKLVTPHRTDTNIRYYDNEQMKKLINVAALLRGGMKISRISKLSNEELYENILRMAETVNGDESGIFEAYIGQMISAGLGFDESLFNQAMSNAVRRFGIPVAYKKVLIPMLHRVGLFWTINDMNPAQEHFITNLVKQKIHAAIDSLPPAPNEGPSTLLFLPQNEDHEIGLLMAKYLLRNAGKRVIYLGQRVPFNNLKSTIDQCKPNQLLFFLIQIHPIEQLQEYLQLISNTFSELKLFVSGITYLHQKLDVPENITWITEPEDFEKLID